MFDNPEECFLFKDDLDYELEECEPEGDNMPEIESKFLMLQEFAANTQIAESHTSVCSPMDQQPSVLSDQNEECACVFAESQDKVTFHIFEDHFTDLLRLAGKMYFLVFMDQKHVFNRHLDWPSFCFFCLLEENESIISVSSHLLDWLHWKDHMSSKGRWLSSGFEALKSR